MRYYVFGSNLEGVHGAGSAKVAAERHGAIRGVGAGPQGGAWAIPTKASWRSAGRALTEIAPYVLALVEFAKQNPSIGFDVVRIGCGFAGYTDIDIAPLFAGAPHNIVLPQGWREIIEAMADGD